MEALDERPEPCFPGAVEPRPEDPVFQVVTTEPGIRCWVGPEGDLVDRFAALVATLPPA